MASAKRQRLECRTRRLRFPASRRIPTTGLLVYTTEDGTLTVRETGVSKLTGNPSNGILTSLQEIVSGTGKFEGATGVLYNAAKDVNGVFYSTITGTLCLVKRH